VTAARQDGRVRIILALSALLLTAVTYVVHRAGDPVSVAPGGPYAVGRARAEWADRGRTDQFAPVGGVPRVLSVFLWYPAVAGPGPESEYAPGAWGGLHRPGSTPFDRIRTGTRDDAPFAAGAFPLVVLVPDLDLAAPQYATLGAGLAGRGYVVAAVTPTYSARLTVLNTHPVRASAAGRPSSPAGRRGLEAVWTADARFVAEEAAARLGRPAGRSPVVYAGHGVGGQVARDACRDDPRCAGAVAVDDGALQLTDPAGRVLRASTVDGLAVSDEAVYRGLFASGGDRRRVDATVGRVAAFLAAAT
jgi:dienelactone hydrolase